MTDEFLMRSSPRVGDTIRRYEAEGLYFEDWKANVRMLDPVMLRILAPDLHAQDRDVPAKLREMLHPQSVIRKLAGRHFSAEQAAVRSFVDRTISYLNKFRPKPEFRLPLSQIESERQQLVRDWQTLKSKAGTEN